MLLYAAILQLQHQQTRREQSSIHLFSNSTTYLSSVLLDTRHSHSTINHTIPFYSTGQDKTRPVYNKLTLAHDVCMLLVYFQSSFVSSTLVVVPSTLMAPTRLASLQSSLQSLLYSLAQSLVSSLVSSSQSLVSSLQYLVVQYLVQYLVQSSLAYMTSANLQLQIAQHGIHPIRCMATVLEVEVVESQTASSLA